MNELNEYDVFHKGEKIEGIIIMYVCSEFINENDESKHIFEICNIDSDGKYIVKRYLADDLIFEKRNDK